ncbi:MAG TPA: enoyl-CoA hydratase/isomerase family protein [Vicinamibacteria bacterium]|jgi:cyclohexa-1,5-dienecarbonyl-CoA hydratase|nr:enoyl-CoA hydratase/isomerase family protein [Vicinamibacteria bacterium]
MQQRFQFLTIENDGVAARIILRRPPLNVLHLEMIQELNRALRGVRPEGGLRAIVFSAEGKAFSAGVSVEDHFPGRAAAMLDAFHEIFRRLQALCCPTIAAVQGAALGGGCELAGFADWVIASETATFGLPEIRLGSLPPLAAVHFPHRIGRARTLQLMLSGETLGAREAEQIGLVDRVVRPQRLGATVEETVERLREKSGPVLRLAKQAVLLAEGQNFEHGLSRVEHLFLKKVMKTRDAKEGLRAFLEKRPPEWTHR